MTPSFESSVTFITGLGASANAAAQGLRNLAIAIGAARISVACDACDGTREVNGFSGKRPCALCGPWYEQGPTYRIGGPC